MTILILGGSNAGLRNGWAAQLQERGGPEQFDNRFLGAVGSLFGLMRLMKCARDDEPKPDAIIFEFFLNDILLFEAGVLRPALLADTLEQTSNICAQWGAPLLCICLEPRPDSRASLARAKARAKILYDRAARRNGLTLFSCDDIFPSPLAAVDYQDENHLSPAASARIADTALAALRGKRVAIPRGSGAAPAFDYVRATDARVTGPHSLRTIESRVFSGSFVELSRGARSDWPGDGQLVALMLLSTEKSGFYLIASDGRAVRKNARSHMQEIVRNLMLLHYTSRPIAVAGRVTISMPKDEAALMSAPEDKTLLAIPPTARFDEQTLNIHGVIFWRRRRPWRRLLKALIG
ncbi:MAG: SGNH/GDSL hydrolase family protein [Methylocystis sp.]|nr:SGNH/GDSL hydrolase family protein [Methylocystis sp.]